MKILVLHFQALGDKIKNLMNFQPKNVHDFDEFRKNLNFDVNKMVMCIFLILFN